MAVRGENIRLDQARDLDVTITLTDSAGVAVPTTDAVAATFQVFSSPNEDATLLLTATLGDGVTVSDGPAGKFRVLVAGSDTGDVNADAIYHFECTLDDGSKPERLWGRIENHQRRTTV